MPSATEIDLVEAVTRTAPLPVEKNLSIREKNVIRRVNRKCKAERKRIHNATLGMLRRMVLESVN